MYTNLSSIESSMENVYHDALQKRMSMYFSNVSLDSCQYKSNADPLKERSQIAYRQRRHDVNPRGLPLVIGDFGPLTGQFGVQFPVTITPQQKSSMSMKVTTVVPLPSASIPSSQRTL